MRSPKLAGRYQKGMRGIWHALLIVLAVPAMAQEPAPPVLLPIGGVTCTTGIPAICTDQYGRRVESSAWTEAAMLPGAQVPPGTLLPATLDRMPGDPEPARPVVSEPPPHPRTLQSAGMWAAKSLTLANGSTWDQRQDYWGGRLHLRIPVAIEGKLAIIGRADVVSVPGQSNPFANLGSAKAIEAYGGAEYVLVEYRGIDFAAAGIGGQVYQLATGNSPSVRLPPQTLAAGGVVAHHHRTGAWAAVLVGQYDAAGPGTRIILSGHFPVKKGFGVLLDWVSGDGGWARPGLGYGIAW